jgi:hypothetical protein
MNTENMIEVTDCNIRELVKAAYDLSKPQGLGLIHAKEGSLSDKDIDEIINQGSYANVVISMDYVYGRACKMTVFRDDENRMWIYKHWYDHSDHQLEKLLETCGIDR